MDCSRDTKQKAEIQLKKVCRKARRPLPGDHLWHTRVVWAGGYSPPPDTSAGKPFKMLASCLKEDLEFLNPKEWPEELELSLIPHEFLVAVGFEYLRVAAPVLVRTEKCPAVEVLTTEMIQNWVAVLQFPKPHDKPWNIKLMLMLFYDDADYFVGFVPKNQDACVEKFKTVISGAKQLGTVDRVGQSVPPSHLLAPPPALPQEPKKSGLKGDFVWQGELAWIEKNVCPNGCLLQWKLDAGFSYSAGSKASIDTKDWPEVIEVVFLVGAFFEGWAKPLLESSFLILQPDRKRTAFGQLMGKIAEKKLCVGRFFTTTGEIKFVLIGVDRKKGDLRGFFPKDHKHFRALLLKKGDEFVREHYGRPLFPKEDGMDKKGEQSDHPESPGTEKAC